MTAKRLKQYRSLCREIESLERQLEAERNSGLATDVVSGSDDQYPYIKRKFTIEGIADGVALEKTKSVLAKRLEERDAIISYIDEIEDSGIRQIFELRHIEGLSWRAVAFRLGGPETEDGVRMKHDRYLRKN